MQQQLPTGRLKAKRRSFEEVVRDLRHAVSSLIRHRPANGGHIANALGTGFFVSPTVFLTCHHVINGNTAPHKDGDNYHLVGNLTGSAGIVHEIADGTVGKNIHLFPDSDLALLIVESKSDQAYAALEYGDFSEGREIGVAGYPIPILLSIEGELKYDSLIFRVAKGVVTARYETNLELDQGQTLASIPVIEVNSLFVPGNSGGPIFDASTGRVLGFVVGYQTVKIRERVEEATLIQNCPEGMEKRYIENVNAFYSLGIRLSRVRSHLETFGVPL